MNLQFLQHKFLNRWLLIFKKNNLKMMVFAKYAKLSLSVFILKT